METGRGNVETRSDSASGERAHPTVLSQSDSGEGDVLYVDGTSAAYGLSVLPVAHPFSVSERCSHCYAYYVSFVDMLNAALLPLRNEHAVLRAMHTGDARAYAEGTFDASVREYAHLPEP